MGVVHPFEVIDVGHQHRQRRLVAARPDNFDGQQLRHITACPQARQCIHGGELRQSGVLHHQLVLETLHLHVKLETCHQVRLMERLLDGITGTVFQQARAPGVVGRGRQEEEREIGVPRTLALHAQQLLAVKSRHLEVAEHRINRLADQQLQTPDSIGGFENAIEQSAIRDSGTNFGPLFLGIIDDQDRGHTSPPRLESLLSGVRRTPCKEIHTTRPGAGTLQPDWMAMPARAFSGRYRPDVFIGACQVNRSTSLSPVKDHLVENTPLFPGILLLHSRDSF